MSNTPPVPGARRRPAILVASSQVVRGGVGCRSAAFALERMGFSVWLLPTVLLPWHPGQGPGRRLVPTEADFSALVDELAGSPSLGEIGGIVTGYLGAAHQAPALARLVAAVRQANDQAIHLCDPVIGDADGLYVAEDVAAAQRDHLLAEADIATPNRFELGWLTGRPVDTEAATLAAARTLQSGRVLVSSSPALRRASVATLLAAPRAAIVAEHAELERAPHGTGDLLAALFLGQILSGADDEAGLARAVSATFELTARSIKAGSPELQLAEYQQALERPMAMVSTRRIAERRLPM